MAIIGIDLGTSNSAAAVLRGGRPVIIPSAEGISLGGKAFPLRCHNRGWSDVDRRTREAASRCESRGNNDGF
jgi:molecular chaperone DnaK (HSP70)